MLCQLWRCSLAALLLWADSLPYRTGLPYWTENVTNFGADKISASALISQFFTELLQPISQLLGIQSKNRKSKKWSGLPPL
jgi:hypothetical protein